MPNTAQQPTLKFVDPKITAKGETRAWVDPVRLDTLWFNTGTLCNLECKNCYIESSPKNDRLIYLSLAHVERFLTEIEHEKLSTSEIGFTGGEPFVNPEMLPILETCLSRGYQTLVLTNAMQPMMKHTEALLALKEQYPTRLKMRVSLDHYTEEGHAAERGQRAWSQAMKGLRFLSENDFQLSIAGRQLSGEDKNELVKGYQATFDNERIAVIASDPNQLTLFPEMDEDVPVPEITTACWGILGVHPNDMMCANSRMVVHRKGQPVPEVAACTLLPYQREFRLGITLKASLQRVYLNHPHCAKFCALGGGSCTG